MKTLNLLAAIAVISISFSFSTSASAEEKKCFTKQCYKERRAKNAAPVQKHTKKQKRKSNACVTKDCRRAQNYQNSVHKQRYSDNNCTTKNCRREQNYQNSVHKQRYGDRNCTTKDCRRYHNYNNQIRRSFYRNGGRGFNYSGATYKRGHYNRSHYASCTSNNWLSSGIRTIFGSSDTCEARQGQVVADAASLVSDIFVLKNDYDFYMQNSVNDTNKAGSIRADAINLKRGLTRDEQYQIDRLEDQSREAEQNAQTIQNNISLLSAELIRFQAEYKDAGGDGHVAGEAIEQLEEIQSYFNS